MRNANPPQRQSALDPSARRAAGLLGTLALAVAGVVAALLAAVPQPIRAQTPTSTPTPAKRASGAAPRPTHIRIHHPGQPVQPAAPAAAPPPVAQVSPPTPETPKWPAFDKATAASVVWDSHGLQINATNSSLEQILHDVATATGAKVEGLTADQRVFGQYGPGQARDVLSELLQGSGYNVIMIGDQGQGTPRQILLSVRQASSGVQPAARQTANTEEDDADEQPAIQEPNGNRPAFAPRNPQQFQQQLRDRQLQQPGVPEQPLPPQQPQ